MAEPMLQKRSVLVFGRLTLKQGMVKLGNEVRKKVLPELSSNKREIIRRKNGGDPHFALDELAEQAVEKELDKWKMPIAYFSEDRGLVLLHKKPELLLIIDPVDGTRPAMASFESACVSIAAVPYSENPKFGEIISAIVLELKSGKYFYADARNPKIESSINELPLLSKKTSTESMFWTTELTAHPVRQIARVCGTLIDNSVALGAVFVFTSSSYSLTRIITGQLDAHVDVGHRIVKDNPELAGEFLKVGRGKLVTLFPYDIAAAAFILERAGGIVTDAYGKPLNELKLITDKGINGQCSIIAASNNGLHEEIMSQLNW